MLFGSGVHGKGKPKKIENLTFSVPGIYILLLIVRRNFGSRYSSVAYQGVRECAVCAWREGCRLKYRNEPNGAIFCPEFSPDLRLQQTKSKEMPSSSEGLEQGANDK